MTRAGADKIYDAKQKEIWRGWVWNRVIERLPVSPSKASVVGLFGKEARDLDHLTRRGFALDRCLNIERIKSAAAIARSRGLNTVVGNLVDIVGLYGDSPDAHTYDVVYADLCGGFSTEAEYLRDALVFENAAISRDCVVVLNTLRGRDAYGQHTRPVIEKQLSQKFNSELVQNLDLAHRGKAFHLSFCCRWAESWAGRHSGNVHQIAEDYEKLSKPVFYSYLSGCQMYDSVVFRFAGPAPIGSPLKVKAPRLLKPTMRKIAAAKAIRTTRLRRAL